LQIVQDELTESVLSIQVRECGQSRDDLEAVVEALLLAAPGPSTIAELAYGAEASAAGVEAALDLLESRSDRGWVLHRHGDHVQFATSPQFARYVRRFLGLEREAKLSNAALEALAIIAYQQPVTRAAIEAVRGVDSTGVIATLLNRGLIETLGRSDGLGQPYVYATTPAFLQHFGIQSLDQLPDLGSADGPAFAEMLQASVAEADHVAPSYELIGSTLAPAQMSGESANS
jgi:segregation and condensation protein B